MYYNIVQPVIGMPKGDEASQSIILAGQALLVKMLITLESHGIFGGSGYIHDCRNASDSKRLFSRQPFPMPKRL